MVRSGALFCQDTHPLTFMLQHFDADVLWTHGMHALATILRLVFRFGGF